MENASYGEDTPNFVSVHKFRSFQERITAICEELRQKRGDEIRNLERIQLLQLEKHDITKVKDGEITRLSNSLEKSLQHIEDLKIQLMEKNKQVEEEKLKQCLTSELLDSDLKHLREEISLLQIDKLNLEGQLNQKESQLSLLLTSYSSIKSQLVDMESQFYLLEKEQKSLCLLMSSLTGSVQQAKDTCMQMSLDSKHLDCVIAEQSEENSCLRKELSRCKVELTVEKSSKDSIGITTSVRTTSDPEERKLFECMQSELEELRRERKEHSTTVSDCYSLVDRQSRAISTLLAEKEKLEIKLSEFEQVRSFLQSEVSRLDAKLKNAEQPVVEIQAVSSDQDPDYAGVPSVFDIAKRDPRPPAVPPVCINALGLVLPQAMAGTCCSPSSVPLGDLGSCLDKAHQLSQNGLELGLGLPAVAQTTQTCVLSPPSNQSSAQAPSCQDFRHTCCDPTPVVSSLAGCPTSTMGSMADVLDKRPGKVEDNVGLSNQSQQSAWLDTAAVDQFGLQHSSVFQEDVPPSGDVLHTGVVTPSLTFPPITNPKDVLDRIAAFVQNRREKTALLLTQSSRHVSLSSQK